MICVPARLLVKHRSTKLKAEFVYPVSVVCVCIFMYVYVCVCVCVYACVCVCVCCAVYNNNIYNIIMIRVQMVQSLRVFYSMVVLTLRFHEKMDNFLCKWCVCVCVCMYASGVCMCVCVCVCVCVCMCVCMCMWMNSMNGSS